jgi:hypothetical protein
MLEKSKGKRQKYNLLPISVLRGSTWLGNPAESIARYFLFPIFYFHYSSKQF